MVKQITDRHVFSMPLPLRIILLAGFLSPVITISSVLTGSVLPPDIPLLEYGAASNLIELTLVTVMSIPASVIAFFIFKKQKVALLLFPFGYIAVCMAPIFLSSFRENVDHVLPSVSSALAIGVLATLYLFLSRGVRRYFE